MAFVVNLLAIWMPLGIGLLMALAGAVAMSAHLFFGGLVLAGAALLCRLFLRHAGLARAAERPGADS